MFLPQKRKTKMEVMCGRVCIPLAGAGVGGFVATNYSPFPSIGRDNIEVISVILNVWIQVLDVKITLILIWPGFAHGEKGFLFFLWVQKEPAVPLWVV